MIVREFLDITTESAFGVPTASPVLNTDRIVLRLDTDNSLTMRPDPQAITIGQGGGFAVDAFDVSDTVEIKGGLSVKPCYSQLKILMGMGLQRIVGGTAPWTTSEPVGDLPSVTIRHAIYQEDTGVYLRKEYNGVKALGGKFDCSRSSKIGSLQLDLQAASVNGTDPDATAFPVPSDTDFATDLVKFSHSTLTLGGAGETEYDSIAIAWQNKIDALWFASPNVAKLRMCGRSSTLAFNLMLNAAPDYRTLMNALATTAAIVAFDGGALSFSINYQGANRVKSVQDAITQAKANRQMVTLESRYSTSAGKDFLFAMGT